MKRVREALVKFRDDERGHAMVGVPSLVGAIGAILLAIGAAADADWLTITGGVVLGLGVLVAGVARHRGIDYDVYTRLDKLDKLEK